MWSRPSDAECGRSVVASAALRASTTASVKDIPQIGINPQPLRFDAPRVLAGKRCDEAERYNPTLAAKHASQVILALNCKYSFG